MKQQPHEKLVLQSLRHYQSYWLKLEVIRHFISSEWRRFKALELEVIPRPYRHNENNTIVYCVFDSYLKRYIKCMPNANGFYIPRDTGSMQDNAVDLENYSECPLQHGVYYNYNHALHRCLPYDPRLDDGIEFRKAFEDSVRRLKKQVEHKLKPRYVLNYPYVLGSRVNSIFAKLQPKTAEQAYNLMHDLVVKRLIDDGPNGHPLLPAGWHDVLFLDHNLHIQDGPRL